MSPREDPATAPIGVLLVGYGRRGRHWHDVCRRRSDVVIGAVVDPDDAARDTAAGAGLEVFASPADAAAARLLTAAIVASPLDRHPPAATACLAAGLAVLVEKPLATTVEEATTIVSGAATRALPALVVQNFRYQPRARALARALEDGAIGRPLAAEVYSSRAIGSPEALWDFVLHHLDAFRVRFGGLPEAVCATVAGRGLEIDLTWASGVRVHYVHEEQAGGYCYRERLSGTDGVLVVDDQRVRLLRDGRRTRTVRARPRVDADQAVLDELLRAVTAGPSAPPSPLAAADNVLTVATVEAVAHSISLGRTVRPGDG